MEFWNEVIAKTPNCSAIAEYESAYYLENRMPILAYGLPFVVRGHFQPPIYSEIIRILKATIGSEVLSARANSSVQDYINNRKYEHLSLEEYVRRIENNDPNLAQYAANNAFTQEAAGQLNIPFPLPEKRAQFRPPRLWIGIETTNTPLHKDSTDNFAFHLFGTKRWILFSIKSAEQLDFQKSKYGNYDNPLSDFSVSTIDAETVFPNGVQRFEVLVGPGDLMFIPFGWGHAVENESTTIMINYWFKLSEYKPLIFG